MLRRRRKLLIALVVVLIAGAIGLAVWLRKHAPPDAVRLLPEVEDGVFYLNLKPLRLAGVLKPATPREPEYEQFVRETGFVFERDLDQAAFAVHGPGNAGGETRYSEIFVGRFDGARLETYFKKLAKEVENYRETTVYAVPHEGRTVRIAILGVDQVAVSNLGNAGAIHEIIDHYYSAAVPRGGPALVRAHYHDVLLGSVAWFIGNIGKADVFKQPPKGLDLPMVGGLFGGSTVVASVRYTGAVHLKLEAFTAGETDAQNIGTNLETLLTIFKGAQPGPGVNDEDMKAFFESIQVEEKKERVILTATLPQGFLKKMLTEAPTEPMVVPPTTPSPAPAPQPKPKKRRK